jgi:hypothetical protein
LLIDPGALLAVPTYPSAACLDGLMPPMNMTALNRSSRLARQILEPIGAVGEHMLGFLLHDLGAGSPLIGPPPTSANCSCEDR